MHLIPRKVETKTRKCALLHISAEQPAECQGSKWTEVISATGKQKSSGATLTDGRWSRREKKDPDLRAKTRQQDQKGEVRKRGDQS